MARRSFTTRAETFGFDTPTPWALDALRLAFHVPRAYEPLVAAWDATHPGTRRALDRLTTAGFVAHQPPVLVDVRARATTTTATRRIARYRTTAKGHRLRIAAAEDVRHLETAYSRVPLANIERLATLLDLFDLEDSDARYGLSCPHAAAAARLPARTARWWVRRLQADGYLRRLQTDVADRREVVPAHWRITRTLCRQLDDVLGAYPAWSPLRAEFRLARSRFLTDIEPSRVGISGATDYDHDIQTQAVLARLLTSPRCRPDGRFETEPRIVLPVDADERPWQFRAGAPGTVFYQPDAVITEDVAGRPRRAVLEYERYQTRRDGWAHIERFLGWLAITTLPFEPAVLRFVVDSEARMRGYVALVEAFADYALDHPSRIPANPVTLAVSSVPRLEQAPDALDDRAWTRITLDPGDAGGGRTCVLHAPDGSPYDDYFARG